MKIVSKTIIQYVGGSRTGLLLAVTVVLTTCSVLVIFRVKLSCTARQLMILNSFYRPDQLVN